MTKRRDFIIHAILITLLGVTMLPFAFVLNNSMRTNPEMYRSFFGVPTALKNAAQFTWWRATGNTDGIELRIREKASELEPELADAGPAELTGNWQLQKLEYAPAMARVGETLTEGYRHAWRELRQYMINTILVSLATTAGVLLLGSVSGYVFSRYRFAGRNALFGVMLSILMVPPVLTLVPSYLLVKELGLLNSYWVLILPYVAGGQIVAIFLFKSFFDGLPEELFEAARLEGAGHFRLYWNLVLPLSKQVAAVVMVMNILGVWNNFLWPLVTNSETRYHVVSTGLYMMSQTATAQNFSAMYAAFVISSIPLIILFVYATRPFMQGLTSGAFKA